MFAYSTVYYTIQPCDFPIFLTETESPKNRTFYCLTKFYELLKYYWKILLFWKFCKKVEIFGIQFIQCEIRKLDVQFIQNHCYGETESESPKNWESKTKEFLEQVSRLSPVILELFQIFKKI